MGADVFLQVSFLSKPFGAMGALKWFVAIMPFDMLNQGRFVGKQLATNLAGILFFSSMHGKMSF